MDHAVRGDGQVTRDVIVFCLIGGYMVAIPVMVIAYTGFAFTRWIWKDKSAV